ncbi:MAG: hypothetical protein ACI8RZ_000847 [Myxococcota bacterium]|jgi:hypothetical protein
MKQHLQTGAPLSLATMMVAAALLFLLPGSAQAGDEQPSDASRQFLSSSLFMLFNLLPFEEPPSFVQVNYGRRLTPKDVLIVEAITWQYHGPLGVPWGTTEDAPSTSFPGRARDYGVGLAYQRFLWRDAFTALHAMPFVQQYFDEDNQKLQTGFQLFMTLRFGYHFEFWSDRLFLEPSVAFTAWPINTNLPDDFAKVEAQWPGYFLFEPGLNIGWNF